MDPEYIIAMIRKAAQLAGSAGVPDNALTVLANTIEEDITAEAAKRKKSLHDHGSTRYQDFTD